MLDTKQLQYFAVSAQCQSFSEAAVVLFTTQSNISKTILALEKQLGFSLFTREAKGIRLTSKGELFYKQVTPVLDALSQIETEISEEDMDVLKISTNPSSWFARVFSDYYETVKMKQIRFNVHTSSTFRILQRLSRLEDDIGFVYVLPEDKPQFEYELKRGNLVFHPLAKTQTMLYYAPEDMREVRIPDYNKQKDICLIQSEKDPFRKYYQKLNIGGQEKNCHVAVTTNSDYIMNTMMKRNRLSNVSPKSFRSEAGKCVQGYELNGAGDAILYGYILNPEAVSKKAAQGLIAFVANEITE